MSEATIKHVLTGAPRLSATWRVMDEVASALRAILVNRLDHEPLGHHIWWQIQPPDDSEDEVR